MHVETQPEMMSISRFCAQHDISRAFLYKLWGRKQGPRSVRIGRKVLISRKSAEEWRQQMEAQA